MRTFKQFLLEEPPGWHGSPHDFDEFKLNKIGTGEGNQSYGWGLYFASSKQIAEWYRDKLSLANPSTVRLDGVTYSFIGNEKHNLCLAFNKKGFSPEIGVGVVQLLQIYRFLPDAIASLHWVDESANNTQIQLLKALKLLKLPVSSGKLYNVDIIPPETEFLDWYKNLKDQSSYIQSILKRANITNLLQRQIDSLFTTEEEKEATRIDSLIANGLGECTPAEIKHRNEISQPKFKKRRIYEQYKRLLIDGIGSDVYHIVKELNGSAEKASHYLFSLGIAGIIYLDGVSRHKDAGTYNYVLFDDSLVNIKEKY